MPVLLSYPLFKAWTPAGTPGAGYKVFSYAAGTSTPLPTYTSSALSVANPNPVILDANGEAQIWLSNATYKIVLQDAAGVTVWTIDNVSGAGGGGSSAASEWVTFSGNPTYISATSFSLVGDQTGTFQPGRRVRTANTAGTVYGTVVAAVFSTLTTVTVKNDSGALDSGLSAVAYGVLAPSSGSLPVWSRVVVHQPATGNLTSGVAVVPFVTGVTELVDALDEFSAGNFTAKVTGVYRVLCSLTFQEGTALTAPIGQVSINGPAGEVFITQTAAQSDTTQALFGPVVLMATLNLTAGQFFAMFAKFNFTGGTVSIASGELYVDRIA